MLRVIWANEREREALIVLEEGVKEYEGGMVQTKDVERVMKEEKNEHFGFVDER